MAWESELIIDGGITSAGLIAGRESAGADYGKIGVTSTEEAGAGELDDYQVLAGGSVWVKGGILSGGTVYSGGRILVHGMHARVTDLTVESGGQLLVYSNFTHFAGNINLASGAWYQCPNAFTGADGVISGGATISSFFYIESGVRFRDLTVTKVSTWVSSGAAIYDLTISGTAATTGVYVHEGGVVSNVTVSVGFISVSSGGTVGGIHATGTNALYMEHGAVLLGGNTFTAGAWAGNPDAFTGEDGIISGAVLKRDLTISDGVIFSGLNCNQQSRTLHISSGAALYDPILASQGVSLRVYDGGYISGGTMIQAFVNLQISSGGTAEGISMPGGQLHVSEGGVASNLDISGGSVYVSGGALASGATITEAAGFMTVYSGGTAAGVTVTNGILAPSSSATISGVTIGEEGFFRANNEYIRLLGTNNFALGTWQSNTAAFTGEDGIISGAVLNRNLTIGDGVIFSGLQFNVDSKTLQVSSGAAVYDPVMINKGTAIDLFDGAYLSGGTLAVGNLYISNGGVAENVTMTGGYISALEGGVASDIHINNGRLYVYDGALISGGTMTGGLILAYGGVMEGVTLTGGSCRVSSGATIAGVTALAAGSLEFGNDATLLGRNNIALGAWYGNTAAFTGDDEVISGVVLTRNLTIGSGVSLGGLTFYENKTLHVSSGAALYNPSMTASGVNVCVHEGAVISGGSMTRGTISVLGGVISDFNATNGDLLISGGRVDLSAGGTFTGALTFDLTGKTGQATALLTGAANLSGATISILADTETIANYVLADGELGNYTINGVADRVSGTTYENFATEIAYTLTGGTLSVFEYVAREVTSGASIIAPENAVVDAATGDTTVYTGKITAATGSTQYFAAGDDAEGENLWLEIGGNTATAHAGLIAAGAAASGGTVGTGRIKVTGGSTLMVFGGGNAGSTQSGAEVVLSDGIVNTLYAGGKSDIGAEGITVSVAGGTVSGTLFAGVLKTGSTGTITVAGDTTLSITGGVISGSVFGGAKLTGGSVSQTGSITVAVNAEGSTYGGSFYCAGYAKGGSITVNNNVGFAMEAGTLSASASGCGVFLGAFADNAATTVTGDLSAVISGGSVGNLFGGGFAQNGGSFTGGDVSITVTGGEVGMIVGGGSHVNSAAYSGTTTVDSVSITVSGGSVGKIFAGGHFNSGKGGYYGTDTVTGDATVTLTGNAEIGHAAGSWNGIDTVGGQRKLLFDDFTGTCGTVGDWDLVTFDGENATTVDLSSATVYGVERWSFDVIGREAHADTALVDIGDWLGSTATIDLYITDAATSLTTWSLAEFNGSLGDLTFNVYDAASTELASGLALGDRITTGTFTNYGFSIDDTTDTLQFGLLSA